MHPRIETDLADIFAEDARRVAAAPAPTLNDRLFKLRNDYRDAERYWQGVVRFKNWPGDPYGELIVAAEARIERIRAQLVALQADQVAA